VRGSCAVETKPSSRVQPPVLDLNIDTLFCQTYGTCIRTRGISKLIKAKANGHRITARLFTIIDFTLPLARLQISVGSVNVVRSYPPLARAHP
jgi:hypothetical protein